MATSRILLAAFFGFQIALVAAAFIAVDAWAAAEWAFTRVAPYAAIAWLGFDAATERQQ